LIKKAGVAVKVLADGDICHALGQDAQDYEAAREKLVAAGGHRGHPGMMEGLQSFQNVTKIPELKRRVLVSLGLLAAYRLGAHVPTPGIDGQAIAARCGRGITPRPDLVAVVAAHRHNHGGERVVRHAQIDGYRAGKCREDDIRDVLFVDRAVVIVVG
jgi:hypothetical protein